MNHTLLELNIKNFVIIDHLKIEFDKGLNIIIGETGSGKSLIIEALELLFGERASKDIVKKDSNKCTIQGLFDLSSKDLKDKLRHYDIEEDTLIITREIYRDGKNKCYVNDRLVNLTILKELGAFLIDFHGQHENQSLLKKEKQLYFLDGFGKLQNLQKQVSDLYNNYIKILNKIQELEQYNQNSKQLNELYNFQLKEIESIAPKVDEDENLINEYKILSNAEFLINTCSKIAYNLYEYENSLYYQLSSIKKDILDVLNIDSNLKYVYDLIESVVINTKEIAEYLTRYKDNIDFDIDKLNTISDRLDKLNYLKSKYGNTLEEVIEYKEKIFNYIQNYNSSSIELEQLNEEKDKVYTNLMNLANELSSKRKIVAQEFSELLINELKTLGIPYADFRVEFNKKEVSKDGIDDIDFLISTNIGEELKPLDKVLSGGEISRIMLALKKILTYVSDISLLIFDEIDTGISGQTAITVGEKILELSKFHQIICITHLPQIASLGNSNFVVEKSIKDNRVYVNVKKLNKKERVMYIAKMLGTDSNSALELAKEMIS